MRRGAVFVIDGHDIDRYPDAVGAAREIEGYDAMGLDYLGADGTVYLATVEGPEWGPVTLHPTKDNRLDELVRLLRAEADQRRAVAVWKPRRPRVDLGRAPSRPTGAAREP